ncbi:hypothetical protein ACF3MZ_24720 [Paenibacillaceae bacterium WGS1546]|uniref:hypothetical protein n=1 Tax=Cohnella sp. WGS1546 TaxID=3366810 RepID=UPI00372D312D
MFKWASWAIRTAATAVLLSFLCIWTTGYIVNSYVESIVKQLNLPVDVQPLALSGVWGTLWGAEKPKKTETAAPSPSPEAKAEREALGSGSSAEDGDPDLGNGWAEPQPSGNERIEDEVSAGVEEDESFPAAAGESAMGRLSDEQRQSLYAMVVSRLDQEQLGRLSEALQGGLTTDELAGIQEMLRAALTDEEYEQMMELLQGTAETDTIPVFEQ